MTTITATPASLSLPVLDRAVGHTARTLIAVPFAIPGVMHLISADSMAAVVPAWVPGGVFWVYFTGVALLAGAIGIHLRRWAPLAGLGLAALMLVFAFSVHLPAMADAAMRQFAIAGFMKDIGLAGGALAVGLLHRLPTPTRAAR